MSEHDLAMAVTLTEKDAEIERLRNYRITLDTPDDVCDGIRTMTIAEAERDYGAADAMKWSDYDWALRLAAREDKISELWRMVKVLREECRAWRQYDDADPQMKGECLREARARIAATDAAGAMEDKR